MMLMVLVTAFALAQQAQQAPRQGQTAAPAQGQAAAPAATRAPAAKAGTVTFNTVFTKLKAGGQVFCETVSSPDTALCRRYCRETPKPDYIWLEMQHSRMDWETIDQMVRICAQEKVPPFVRVPQVYAPDDIQRAADAGALGIIVPMVETIDVVRNAIYWSHNPIMDLNNPSTKPWGFRSQGGNGLWGSDYNSNWNNNCFIMIQIENATGVAVLQRILDECPGVNGVMVASSDFGAQEGDRDGMPTYNYREKLVHDVVLAHPGVALIGPSSWYNNASHPGYVMYQGMPRAQGQAVPAEH